MEFTGAFAGLALALGALLIAAGVVAALLTIVGMILAIIFFKTRQILIPGGTLFILNLLEAPIKYLLWVFKIEEDTVGKMIVEVRNRLYNDRYERTPYASRAMFLPQCLRNPHCPAPLTPEGIRCMNCGRCGIGKIKEEAESLGYMVFIAPGSSLIKRMVKKYRPKAVLGVGCVMEVKEGTSNMASYGVPVQGVILERDGCVDTRVDVAKLMGRIRAYKAKRGQMREEGAAAAVVEDIARMWDNGVELTGVKIVGKT